ncbi:MAG TPA: carotenoid biosynthesis protein [Verrucomicrobiae bacterium]|nr:carotenoid biosynthesis protein [Verrucomicrobiae bacterium]
MRPTASSKSETAPGGNSKILTFAHWLSTFLLVAGFAVALAELWAAPDANWPEALLLALATVGAIIALARQLPMQNILLAAAVMAIVGGAAHALCVNTGVPFGPFTFGPEFGPQIFRTLPWFVPLLWVAMILNSRGVARLILRPWRKIKTYGFWLMGLTATLTTLFDFAFDPFASRVRHYWIWMPVNFPLTWLGAPLTNFLGWVFLSLLILAFVTPTLIRKQLSRQTAPDFHPLAAWLGGILLFGIASGMRGLWPAVVTDGIIFAVVALFAIRGALW